MSIFELFPDCFATTSTAGRRRVCRTTTTVCSLIVLFGCSSKNPSEPRSIVEKPKTEEEILLANASNTYDEGLFSISEDNWTQLRDGFPASYYAPLAELKIADAQYFRGDYPAALASYEEFSRLHPGSEALAYVRFQIANCHIEQYRGRKYDQTPLHSAIKAYENLIKEHPESEYVIFARRNLDRSRQLLAENEAYVADFYARQGAEKAAASRKQMLYTLYPDSAAAAREGFVVHTPDSPEPVAVPEKLRNDYKPGAPSIISAEQLANAKLHNQVASDERVGASRSTPVYEEDLTASKTAKPITTTQLFKGIECGEQEGGQSVFIVYPSVEIDHFEVVGNSLSVTLVVGDDFQSSAAQGPDELTCEAELLHLGLKNSRAEIANGKATVKFQLTDPKGVLHLRVLSLDRPTRVILFASNSEVN